MYSSMLLSQFIPPSPSPGLENLVHSLNRFINTTFLDSICMYYYIIFVFLFLTYFTMYDRLCCQVSSVVSDSVRPHGLQPTRLLRPWDSPGKNIGVGCHFLLQCMKVESESEVTQSCLTLRDPMDCSLPGSSIHGIFQAIKSN